MTMEIGHDPAQTYRQEAAELLAELETSLLGLEDEVRDDETIDAAFRALHTIKGSGSMFGFDDIAAFAHHFETAFDRVRSGEVEANRALVDSALAAVDHIRALLEGTGSPEAGDPILAALDAAVSTTAAPIAVADASDEAVTDEAARTYRITFYPNPDALRFGADPRLMFEELRALGPLQIRALIDRVPPLETLDPTACYLGWELRLETGAPRDAIDDVFLFVADDSELTIEEALEVDAPAEPKAAPTVAEMATDKTPTQTAQKRSPATESIRVSAERLDALMDQVGELVIMQTRLADTADRLGDMSLRAVAEDIERLVTNLRDETLGIRMLPIGLLFSKFKRVVRDLSGELGKDVEFVTSGEDTEVDKTFIDRLNDPLVHLIRNAVDHGIEDAKTRLAAGKRSTGTLRLSAEQASGEVRITITDDGAGLDMERIKARAIERGLMQAEDELTDKFVRAMIFEPGLSTAAELSSVSGRGVGMDVVRRTIEGLRGTIDVTSLEGAGSTFTLRLPLTLAMFEGFHVRVDEGTYVLPLDVVEECVELSSAEDTASSGRSLISIRDENLPFVRLHDLFGVEYPPQEGRRVVVLRSGDERVGVVVDEILGQRQTVIKPLTKVHRSIPGLAGATILGNGRVALILDLPTVMELARGLNTRGRSTEAEAPKGERRLA